MRTQIDFGPPIKIKYQLVGNNNKCVGCMELIGLDGTSTYSIKVYDDEYKDCVYLLHNNNICIRSFYIKLTEQKNVEVVQEAMDRMLII